MKNTTIYKNAFIALALGVTLASCGSDKEQKQDSGSAVSVTVAEVETGDSNTILAGSGQINALNNATLSTRMMGYVESLPVKIGQKVKKGDLLISINNVDLRAKKAQVEASITEATVAFNNAKKDYERFQNLFRESSASQKELDDMTARYEMAKARLESANQMKNEVNSQFAYANIRAPFSGVVTNTYIEEGDMANPGVPLVSVESPGGFEVVAKVAENNITGIQVGTKALVQVKALDTIVTGKVTELSASAQNTGGQYLMKVQLDKTDAKILSGMYATVRLETDKASDEKTMVTVPSKALIQKGQLSGIYTLGQDNVALLRWLRLGETYGDEVEVLSGLSKGETYIVSAQGKLYNGAKVTIQ
ncbi:efflux RND transporter periplasmic adaptor subunit [Flagellimonas taeanensis]|uniref:RND family efflux transporter, MFP subunit n=1 Tax=Flagellimonas taeanensis TaxID=1005926 RepID=A0A1M6Y7F9_9FLAO|nr:MULTISPECIES: efflux RND transporter periplasmic adaptor subunit [Allomuricauda]MDC6383844.1 efflux RND transporter periplasmic adaptor subunit [Muricauda sp. SK9]RIV48466.1 efflux RND transporter periplasmic adaptor subunit [Allomuricauda taeanensis]SFC06180.1 RND family efflux transporter, MFP subunit [Allomuricauda taeanensis]SHL14113.1 RND family efflux transporter, MFP subunit [Allomuricauda taeanensis]